MHRAEGRQQVLAAVAPAPATGPDLVAPVTAATTPAGHRTGLSWVVAAVLATAGAFGLVVGWAIHSGAIHRAYSDDWAYLRIAQRFLTGGGLHGVGWNDTSLLGPAGRLRSSSGPADGQHGRRPASRLDRGAPPARCCSSRSWAATPGPGSLWPLAPLTLVVAMPGFGSTVATYMTEQLALFAQLLDAWSVGLLLWRRWERTGRLPLAYLGALVVVGHVGRARSASRPWPPVAGRRRHAADPSPSARQERPPARAGGGRRRRPGRPGAGGQATPLSGPTMAIVRGSITGQLARIYQAGATRGLVPGAGRHRHGLVRPHRRRHPALVVDRRGAASRSSPRRSWWPGRRRPPSPHRLVARRQLAAASRAGTRAPTSRPPTCSAPRSWFAIEVVAAGRAVPPGGAGRPRRHRWPGGASRVDGGDRPCGHAGRTTALTRMTAVWATLGAPRRPRRQPGLPGDLRPLPRSHRHRSGPRSPSTPPCAPSLRPTPPGRRRTAVFVPAAPARA